MEREVQKLAGEHIGEETDIRKVVVASFLGTAIETYDLYLYGTAAALVFGPLFFPGFGPTVGTLLALATFAVSFIARPVGAVIFGHWGDRLGRKAMLIITLLLMGLSTFFIGLLPTYAAIGIAAPLILVALRFLQGVGFGGEWSGAVLMIAEHAPPGKRGFYSGFNQVGPVFGFLASTGIFLLVSTALSETQFEAWGWRIPFLLSIVLVGLGLYIRLSIEESPVFRRVMETRSEVRIPLLSAIRDYPRVLVLTTGSLIVVFGMFYLFSTYSLSYGTQELGLEDSTILYCVMIAIVVNGISIPIFSALSDWVGRRRVCLWAAALTGLWAFPYFWLVDTANPILITLAFSVQMVIYGMIYGPIGAFLAEHFGTRVRYTGMAVAYNLGGILGAAFAPIIANRLLAWTGGSWSISLYILAMATVSFLSIFLLSETYTKDLAEDRDEAPATGGTRASNV